MFSFIFLKYTNFRFYYLNMKHLIILALLFISTNCIAQINISIKSEQTRQSLPYATVANITKKKVFSADASGSILMAADAGDSLVISYVGYENKVVIWRNKPEEIILLQDDENMLAPLVFKACEKMIRIKDQHFGTEKPVNKFGQGYFGWSYGFSEQRAVKILSPNAGCKVVSLSFWTEDFTAPAYATSTPMLISFYTVVENDSFPGQPFDIAPIVYVPTNKKKQTIHLDSLNFRIPAVGCFVIFQYIMDEKYIWKMTTRDMNDGTEKVIDRYGISLKACWMPENPLLVKSSFVNQWFAPVKNSSLKYEAEFSCCK